MAAEEGAASPLTTQEVDLATDAVLGDRPLCIRVIVEFVGTF